MAVAIYALRFISFVFAALAFVPAGAHFFTMFNKMKLDGPSYLAAQRAYDGWSLFGIVVLGALRRSWQSCSICIFRPGCCRFPQYRSHAVCLLDAHLSDQPGNPELDDPARKLGVAPAPMGVFARHRGRAQCLGVAGAFYIRPARSMR
jgi:hypothetical protein